MSAQWHKVFNDLWGNKTRTILIVLSIATGVFAVGLVVGSRVILSREMTASYLAVNPAHATLYTDPFDDDFVEAVRRVKGVREAEGRRSVVVRFKVGPDESHGDAPQWRTLHLFAIPDFEDIRINKVSPVSGAWPPLNHELLVERASVSLVQPSAGDVILVETPDGKQREMRIAGLAYDLNQVPASFTHTAYGYITFDTLEWLGEPRNMNELNIVVAENAFDPPGAFGTKAHIQQVANQVVDKVEKSGRKVNSVRIPTPGKHMADDSIQSLLLLLTVLGFLSLVASGFLVVNMISALLAQQTRQIGIMKAIGASAPQIVGMYLGLVLVLGLLALALAVPLGGLGAVGFAQRMARGINFDIKTPGIPTEVLALEIVVGLLVPLLAALNPIITGTRVTVREAISDYGLVKTQFGKSLLDRLVERVRVLSRPLLLSLRNTFRHKGRLALTLITLTLAGAIFIAVSSVRASLLLTLDDAMTYWKYDVSVDFERSYRIEQIERDALAVPGVVKVEGWGLGGVRRVRPDGNESGMIRVSAPPARTGMIQPTVLQGRWLLPEDENAVVVNTDLLKDEPDIRVGDEIVLKIEDRKTAWRVVGIAHEMLSGPILHMNYPYFARVVHEMGHADSAQVVTQQHDGTSRAQIAKALEAHFKHAGLRVSSTETTTDVRARMDAVFSFLVLTLLVMAIMLAVVGALGLTGTMTLNVLERTREIGVMRAIGASDGAVLWIFMAESIFIGALSWLVSVILALPVSKVLSDALGTAFIHNPLSYTFSTSGALIWLVIAVILAGLASFLPARRASRLSVREVLAYE